jgi:hypothetical protein
LLKAWTIKIVGRFSGSVAKNWRRQQRLSTAEQNWLGLAPSADVALTPRRKVDVEVLRSVLAAVRNSKSLNILYQSMSSDHLDPVWRRITPHAFGYDGFRWHARALCHKTSKFKDFLLRRTLGIGSPVDPGVVGAQDSLWRETFDIVIVPHPDLSVGQQAVVARDYGMTDGNARLTVRYAMLFYVLKRLGLLNAAQRHDPRTQQIVAANAADLAVALERAQPEFDGAGSEAGMRP